MTPGNAAWVIGYPESVEPNQAWIEKLAELRAEGRPCTMVVVTEVAGSAPREAGARMLVCDGRLLWGTIGGGNLEKQAIEHGAALLSRAGSASESVDYPLAEKTGQCCGGKVTLYYETFRWVRHTVAVFGAGHVGQALGGLAPWMRARVLLIDGRREEELVPSPPEEALRPYELVCVDAPEGEIDGLPQDALVVIMTHSHALDLVILERALRRGGFAYIGLIGSARKWERFKKRLVQRGVPGELIERVWCPIGVSRGSKDPAAIALSTATQLSEVMAVGRGGEA